MPTEPNPSTASANRRFGCGVLLAVALLSGLIAGGFVLFLTISWNSHDDSRGHEDAGATLYHCPMHPTIVQDHPGDCPICGMRLVPSTSTKEPKAAASGNDATRVDEATTAAGLMTVEIDPARQQLIGLQTTEVTHGPVGGAWRTVGRVAIDETRVRHINLKVPGFIERIYVDFIGKAVKQGDPLFSIYSPELLAAQEEYLLALRTRAAMNQAGAAPGGDGDALVAATHRKLRLWDVPAAEIERIGRSGTPTKALTFYSPVAGVVTKKDVVEGMKLDAGAMPYEIVDLSSLWVLADVYETELRFVQEGMAAVLKLNAFPNREFSGHVGFIDPLLDPQTRTVKVRLTFPNPTGELRPEMYGEVLLLGAPHEGLRLPPDAVIDSGTETLVFVAVGEGKFQPRRVKLGGSDGTYVEILEGLEQGERVVTRANFLVDSESRLRASLAELTAGRATTSPESARVLPGATAPTASPAAGVDSGATPPSGHAGHAP